MLGGVASSHDVAVSKAVLTAPMVDAVQQRAPHRDVLSLEHYRVHDTASQT